MSKIIFAPEAESDLDLISSYTYDFFGPNQEVKHMAELDTFISDLLDEPWRDQMWQGKNGPKLTAMFKTQHRLFYRRNDAGDLIILRILGAQMDFDRHF